MCDGERNEGGGKNRTVTSYGLGNLKGDGDRTTSGPGMRSEMTLLPSVQAGEQPASPHGGP